MAIDHRSRETEEAKQWALTLLLMFVIMILSALLFEELAMRGFIVLD